MGETEKPTNQPAVSTEGQINDRLRDQLTNQGTDQVMDQLATNIPTEERTYILKKQPITRQTNMLRDQPTIDENRSRDQPTERPTNRLRDQ